MPLWLAIAIGFAASVAVNVLLRPRPPRQHTPAFQAPRANEGETLPVIFGTVEVSPNITWCGSAQKWVPDENLGIARYAAKMLGSLCHGPVDGLVDIRWGGKSLRVHHIDGVLEGSDPPASPVLSPSLPFLRSSDAHLGLFVLAPDFLGGPMQRGGPVGRIHLHWGTLDDDVCGLASEAFGAEAASAYPGRCYAAFGFLEDDDDPPGDETAESHTGYVRGDHMWSIPNGNISASAFLDGRFQFSWNDPVPPDVSFILYRYARGVTNAPIGTDANPADIIYEILTNPIWGLGRSASRLDLDSFTAAGAVLAAEGMGLSFAMTDAKSAEQWIADILDAAGGTLRSNLATGLVELILHRADYDTGALPVLTAANSRDRYVDRPLLLDVPSVLVARYRQFQGFAAGALTDELITESVQTGHTYTLKGNHIAFGWIVHQGETTLLPVLDYVLNFVAGTIIFVDTGIGNITLGQPVAITYTAQSVAPGYTDATVQQQNLAIAEANGGVLRDEFDLPLVATEATAQRIVRRVARQTWRRPRTVRGTVNRAAGLLQPGDVVMLDWPEAAAAAFPVRLARVRLGELTEPWYEVEGVEALDDAPGVVGGADPTPGGDETPPSGALPVAPTPVGFAPLDPASITLALFSANTAFDFELEIADDASGSNAVYVTIAGTATTYTDSQTVGTTKYYRLRHTAPGYTPSDWIGPISYTAASGTTPDPEVVLPTVSAAQTEADGAGTVTLTITDPQARVTGVFFSSKSGATAETALLEDDAAPWEASVALPEGLESYIRYQVRYRDGDGLTVIIEDVLRWNAGAAPAGESYVLTGTVPATLTGGRQLMDGEHTTVNLDTPGEVAIDVPALSELTTADLTDWPDSGTGFLERDDEGNLSFSASGAVPAWVLDDPRTPPETPNSRDDDFAIDRTEAQIVSDGQWALRNAGDTNSIPTSIRRGALRMELDPDSELHGVEQADTAAALRGSTGGQLIARVRVRWQAGLAVGLYLVDSTGAGLAFLWFGFDVSSDTSVVRRTIFEVFPFAGTPPVVTAAGKLFGSDDPSTRPNDWNGPLTDHIWLRLKFAATGDSVDLAWSPDGDLEDPGGDSDMWRPITHVDDITADMGAIAAWGLGGFAFGGAASMPIAFDQVKAILT